MDYEDYHREWGARREGSAHWTEAMSRNLLSPPSHPEMLGRIGRYEVERLIGSGGMGVVFKAYDTELNRPVAVKLLAPYLAENGSARKRFAREARAAAAVVDEHVVAIHNVETGDDPERPPFLVMKYIAGGSLQQRLDRDGPLDVCEILRIGMQTARGLAAAHAQGLIHRDVKPSNILLDEGVDRALLTDFGLARAEDDACLTRSGFHPGTPHYMSPEQVRGKAIDGRSDLFSLGCVLYALCTGHPPFRAETSYAVLRRITDDTARPIRELNPNIPDWLEQIVMKLLSKSREDRFDSAEQVAELLEDCLAHVQQPTTTPLPYPVAELAKSFGIRPLTHAAESLGGFRYSKTPIIKWFAAFAFFTFAGILIVLETNKGTLTIRCDADDVPVRIMQGNKVVEQLTVSRDGKSIRIAAGNYEVEVDGRIDEINVLNGRVSLKRSGTEVVNIVHSENASSSHSAAINVDSENGIIVIRGKKESVERTVDAIDKIAGQSNSEAKEVGNSELDETSGSQGEIDDDINASGYKPDLYSDPEKSSIAESVGRITSRFSSDVWRVEFALYKLRGVQIGERLIVARPYGKEGSGSATWFARIEVTEVFDTFAMAKVVQTTRNGSDGVYRLEKLRLGDFVTRVESVHKLDMKKPTESESEKTSQRPKFATPEILMQHYADCQMQGDELGCIDSYSDEVINGFASSYLMTAVALSGDMIPGEPNRKQLERDPKQQHVWDELETLLENAIIENPPAIAWAALLQVAGAYYSDDDLKKREALNNDQLAMIATSSTMLKNPRQFVKDFLRLSAAYEDEQSKEPLPKNRRYRIEYNGDLVWSVNVEDNSRMGLKRFGDTWLIHEAWSSTAEEAASPDESRIDAIGDESTSENASEESD